MEIDRVDTDLAGLSSDTISYLKRKMEFDGFQRFIDRLIVAHSVSPLLRREVLEVSDDDIRAA